MKKIKMRCILMGINYLLLYIYNYINIILYFKSMRMRSLCELFLLRFLNKFIVFFFAITPKTLFVIAPITSHFIVLSTTLQLRLLFMLHPVHLCNKRHDETFNKILFDSFSNECIFKALLQTSNFGLDKLISQF